VFVVEQRCPYLDADGRDSHSLHLLGRNAGGELAVYLRIVEPGYRFPEPSIGRVVTRSCDRGKGWGRVLMLEGIRHCREVYPGLPIRISAQHYLEKFYNGLGFVTEGEGNPYDEDGIPHVQMILRT
jgi:ElaA protein